MEATMEFIWLIVTVFINFFDHHLNLCELIPLDQFSFNSTFIVFNCDLSPVDYVIRILIGRFEHSSLQTLLSQILEDFKNRIDMTEEKTKTIQHLQKL